MFASSSSSNNASGSFLVALRARPPHTRRANAEKTKARLWSSTARILRSQSHHIFRDNFHEAFDDDDALTDDDDTDVNNFDFHDDDATTTTTTTTTNNSGGSNSSNRREFLNRGASVVVAFETMMMMMMSFPRSASAFGIGFQKELKKPSRRASLNLSLIHI